MLMSMLFHLQELYLTFTLLQIIHGNQSCGAHFVSFLVQAYKRALPVYLPVYLIPALIVHREGLSKRYNSLLCLLNEQENKKNKKI